MGETAFGEKKKILKSKPTKESKGAKVPTTTYGAIGDGSVIKQAEKKTKKPFKAGNFKNVKVKGTKKPFGFKPLPCKPVYMYHTPKYLADNTRSKQNYKPQGFPTEQFLKIPREVVP